MLGLREDVIALWCGGVGRCEKGGLGRVRALSWAGRARELVIERSESMNSKV